jgi:hypothetical protein
MVCILMSNEDMLNRGRIDIDPTHFFCEPVIIVSGIDHDCSPVFCVKEDVGYPLTDTRRMPIYPPGIKRLENLLAAVSQAHYPLLKL